MSRLYMDLSREEQQKIKYDMEVQERANKLNNLGVMADRSWDDFIVSGQLAKEELIKRSGAFRQMMGRSTGTSTGTRSKQMTDKVIDNELGETPWEKGEPAACVTDTPEEYNLSLSIIDEGIRAIVDKEMVKRYVVDCDFPTKAAVYTYRVARWLDVIALTEALERKEDILGVVTKHGTASVNATMVTVLKIREVTLDQYRGYPSALISIVDMSGFKERTSALEEQKALAAEIRTKLRNKERADKLKSLIDEMPSVKDEVDRYESLVRRADL